MTTALDVSERSRCSAPDCSNAVELTAKGRERRFCRRHRPGPLAIPPPQADVRTDSDAQPVAASPAVHPRQYAGQAANEVFTLSWWQKTARTIEKMVKGYKADFKCPECGYRSYVKVDIPDIAGQLKAAKELMEEAYGRPGVAEGAPGGTVIIVERTWPVAGDSDPDELYSAPAPADLSPVQG